MVLIGVIWCYMMLMRVCRSEDWDWFAALWRRLPSSRKPCNHCHRTSYTPTWIDVVCHKIGTSSCTLKVINWSSIILYGMLDLPVCIFLSVLIFIIFIRQILNLERTLHSMSCQTLTACINSSLVTVMAMATSYNWLFLWDYTCYKWGLVSTYNW